MSKITNLESGICSSIPNGYSKLKLFKKHGITETEIQIKDTALLVGNKSNMLKLLCKINL